ncbi:MAG: DegV family protein [Candidatus Izemoplasmatales bacterium]|uniref:DegV family protein n=1 Tax=Hujiaoplasma nucleasis TaxID=2725268 RepID=A0A7L6MZL6_9MOLU|nr:DegV family protein [Hujiaoplasma nucleasis]QLY39433.1 DegV family protein [Hujiaoplasma nucleasis]
MRKTKLVTDSTCDLSKELINKYDIEVIPLLVNFKEKSYLDGVDIQVPQMYDMVTDTNELPKTAAPAPGAFVSVFKKYLEEDYDIIYMGIGSKFSATLNSAKVAKDLLESDHIYLIDSLNLSSGTGLLLLKAGEMIKRGLSPEQIKIAIEEMVPKVRSQFVINTLDYLYKGGRLNALSAFFGTMLRFKPIIKVRDGLMGVGKKGRGKIENAINIMLSDMLGEADQIDQDFMMITHSMADDKAVYIKDKIKDKISVKEIHETQAGCVISSHCGKGTIGVLYILK